MDEHETLEEVGAIAPTPTRRVVLAGAGVIAVAALGACTTYGQGPPPVVEEEPPPEDEPDPQATDEDGSPPPPKALADTSEIPVGGGKIIDDQRMVITQPQAGTFKAFTAVCTHQGCLVTDISNGKIVCPCHGSVFNAANGAVVNGPAGRPLREIKIKVTGSAITKG
jgi:Rieske Fe-S protein